MAYARKRRRLKHRPLRMREVYKRSQLGIDMLLDVEMERKRSTFREGVRAKLQELVYERPDSITSCHTFNYPHGFRYRSDDSLDRSRSIESSHVAPSPLSLSTSASNQQLLANTATLSNTCIDRDELGRENASRSSASAATETINEFHHGDQDATAAVATTTITTAGADSGITSDSELSISQSFCIDMQDARLDAATTATTADVAAAAAATAAVHDVAVGECDGEARPPRNPMLYSLLIEARVDRQTKISAGHQFHWPHEFAVQHRVPRALRPDQVQQREERIDELARMEADDAINCASSQLCDDYHQAVAVCKRWLSADRKEELRARRELVAYERAVRRMQRKQRREARATRHAVRVARFLTRDLQQEARTELIMQFHRRWEVMMPEIGNRLVCADLLADYVEDVAACRAQLFHDARHHLEQSAVEARDRAHRERQYQQRRNAKLDAVCTRMQEENRREHARCNYISRFHCRWAAMWPPSEPDSNM